MNLVHLGDLENCFAQSPDAICTGSCLSLVERYIDECGADAEQLEEILAQQCPDLITNFCAETARPQSDLATCLADYNSSPDSICSDDDCRDTLELYVDRCLNGAAADQFRDTFDRACDGNRGDATTATATLASTITALVVALAAAFN